jgi:hypothetical protein
MVEVVNLLPEGLGLGKVEKLISRGDRPRGGVPG